MKPSSALFACLFALAACQQGDPNEGKRMPKLAPAPEVAIPASLRIPLEIDGREVEAIDAARLASVPPDFADDQRKAWRIATLAGGVPEGATVKVTGAGGVVVELPARAGNVPVLLVSRRGEVVATMLDPKEPFPSYHGKGGRLGRSNDPLPRVESVQRIAVVAQAAIELVVKRGDQEQRWTRSDLARVPKLSVQAEGEGAREAWALRALVRELAGPTARVTALSGEGSRRVAIDEAAWKDESRQPILRLNKQGRFKFQWVDAGGEPAGDELRNVRSLEVAP